MASKAQFPMEQSVAGEFKRQDDAFRGWVTADGRSGYPAAAGRYHLYVSWACPWAHRTIIVRKLKQLEPVIGMTVVDPIRDERGWAFRDGPGHSQDALNGFRFLSEAYHATDPTYRGRVTVPVLWDTVTKRIVSNSDDDLMRMFNGEFNRFTESTSRFVSGTAPSGDRRVERPSLRAGERWRVSRRVRDLPGRVRKGGAPTVRDARPGGAAPRRPSLSLRLTSHRNGLAALRDADTVRCRLPRPFQVQPPPDRRLSPTCSAT